MTVTKCHRWITDFHRILARCEDGVWKVLVVERKHGYVIDCKEYESEDAALSAAKLMVPEG